MATDAKKVTVKRVFGSLINNATAIDGAKYSPWWVGLIMFILGIFLPILPLFVSAANTEGTTFMSSYEYGLGLDKTFGEAINSIDGTLTFNNTEKTISYQANSTYTAPESCLIGSYVSSNGQYELRIYYSAIEDETEISNFIINKEAVKYTRGTTVIANINEENVYTPSSIYFFKKTFALDIYANNSVDKRAVKTDLADLNCFDYDGGDLKAYFVGTSFNKDVKTSRVGAVDNLKEFLNVTYATARKRNMWLGSLFYAGIFVVINLFMMLMIFLMSRGKNNPNNCLNFWHCIKIDWWACFCPGLLAMIFGFIFIQYAVMIYVMLVSFRTMWLTMKEMRPQY